MQIVEVDEGMNDEYTAQKRELEDLYARKARMEADIKTLITIVEESSHPLREERLASLRQLLQKLA